MLLTFLQLFASAGVDDGGVEKPWKTEAPPVLTG
jgi:hypothetical protein